MANSTFNSNSTNRCNSNITITSPTAVNGTTAVVGSIPTSCSYIGQQHTINHQPHHHYQHHNHQQQQQSIRYATTGQHHTICGCTPTFLNVNESSPTATANYTTATQLYKNQSI
ncbi:protein bunched, class 2/F/G isoform-like [Condylostylus longicornis]|uniref:protein bunched, class 2/F/G isoform-like n=1 Tax=Condylostylus longicornis TaxID=2530218 RepID=UPI00244DCCC0|nr:protein bunched, class 2/F/G isoform-like [Condylostylus longicornis]